MTRIDKFKTLRVHPRHSKMIAKLSLFDLAYCDAWIQANDELDQNDFEMRVNRMFMDNPDKPKNWATIMEVIATCNVKETR